MLAAEAKDAALGTRAGLLRLRSGQNRWPERRSELALSLSKGCLRWRLHLDFLRGQAVLCDRIAAVVNYVAVYPGWEVIVWLHRPYIASGARKLSRRLSVKNM